MRSALQLLPHELTGLGKGLKLAELHVGHLDVEYILQYSTELDKVDALEVEILIEPGVAALVGGLSAEQAGRFLAQCLNSFFVNGHSRFSFLIIDFWRNHDKSVVINTAASAAFCLSPPRSGRGQKRF